MRFKPRKPIFLFLFIYISTVYHILAETVENEPKNLFEKGPMQFKPGKSIFKFLSTYNDDDSCSENIENPTPAPEAVPPVDSPSSVDSPVDSPTPLQETDLPTTTTHPSLHPSPHPTPDPTLPKYSIECPDPEDGSPVEIFPHSIYDIGLSIVDMLCTLTYVKYKPDGEETLIPLARSYDGNDWEKSSGPLMNLINFDCSSTEEELCTITTPSKLDEDPSSKFLLTSFGLAEASTLKSQDIFARFLEQTTFGPTRAQIQPFKDLSMTSSFDLNDDIAQWVADQMYEIPATSHRAFYRKNSDTRIRDTKAAGTASHVCAPNSRWNSYVFDYTDNDITIEEVATDGDPVYALIVDGVIRTEMSHVELGGDPAVNLTSGTYEICNYGIEEYLGGTLCVMYEGNKRYFTDGNPPVKFLSTVNIPENVIDMGSATVLDTDFVIVPGTMDGHGSFLHPNEIDDPKCDSIVINAFPVFVSFDDGTYLSFDPRLKLIENTLESPATDGGNSAYIHGSRCTNTPRTFLNAEQCVYTEEAACSNSKPVPPVEIPMTDANLLTLHDLTGAYPYVVTGLRIEDLGSPCKRRVRARFMKTGHDETSCPVTTFDDDTAGTLGDLLSLPMHEADTDIRDVLYEDLGDDCSVAEDADLSANPLYVFADNECWLCVHPDEQSVIDFTPWVSDHPGMAPPITDFAERGETTLVFPSHHEMWQWEDNKDKLPYLGRYKGGGAFRSFPSYYQLESVKAEFDLLSSFSASGVVVCGSPNEVTNDLSLGDTGLSFITVGLWYFDSLYQKDRLWLDIIQHSNDQLRQRIAWALCQIFAISQEAVQENQNNEGFVYYYDIFVRNAFESYLDIMKEVSTSPLMGLMLTYHGSQSTAYVLGRQGVIQFADENFAREIMQLFSIGLVMLNMDGTPILDENGNKILTYTNDHIMSYARAWTGYDFQVQRGNMDRDINTPNRLDPMNIIPEWRDVFPKLDLKGGFIGDSYPLCADLPSKHHMRKGATYRLLGKIPLMETQTNLPYWWGQPVGPDPMRKKINLDTSSPLFAKLCNDPNGGTDCNFQSQLTLDENLDCYGEECDVDTLRMIEVGDVYFEYIRQPCVELAYYNDAKTVAYPWRQKEMCGNPATEVAGAACCNDPDPNNYNSWFQPCSYTDERVTFLTAEARCSDLGMDVCAWTYSLAWDSSPDCWYFNDRYLWNGAACLNQVKVGDNGMVTIVHAPQNMIFDNLEQKVRESSPNFFSVYWDNDEFPNTDNSCGNGACELVSDGCLCNTTVAETQVFSSAPTNKEEVMSSLFIGSVSPDSFDDGEYSDPVVNGDVKIYFHHLSGDSYDKKTIFEVEHLGKKYFYKNLKSEVFIVDDLNVETAYNFRNPPHFNNIQQADARDAEHETQAVLESYFYHPNVAPFLAIHFIQRLGISNPSPRYIEAVATAFKSGVYEYEESTGSTITYGNSEYGNLGALVAAVLLDREARSLVLDLDSSKGSLREPLIKVTNMFRSMEYEGLEFYRSTRFDHSISGGVTGKIGQMAHDIQSVFSFFKREFSPNGPLGEAKLTAPEGQQITTPTVLGTMNGLFSLIKFGLSYCHGGFATWLPEKAEWCGYASENSDYNALGRLMYTPQDSYTSEEIIDELATLLTGGRLNSESRKIIEELYDAKSSEDSPEAALRLAQQLITVSPEFHSTSLMQFSGEARDAVDPPLPSDRPYKSVVFILLVGGIDSFNVIVPLDGCTGITSYDQYQTIRGSVAISKGSLLPISTPGQTCSEFGVHPDLSILRDLYNEGDLSFYANVGVLFEEVTKEDWVHKTHTQLFAHNTQQQDSQTIDPFEDVAGTGVLGRMADRLTALGYQTGSYSISGQNKILSGEPQKSPAQVFISKLGITEFNAKPSTSDMESHMRDLNNITSSFSGKYGKTWASIFNSAMNEYNLLSETLADVQTDMNFPGTWLGGELRQASMIMKKRNELGNDRQFFHTTSHGWDTHSEQFTSHDSYLPDLNDALSTFVDEMKSQGLWDDTTVVIASDFGRTMSANSGDGTDHAWGGNYWVMGGDVKGGKMLGSFPDDLSDSCEWSIGRGRFIPTTSWDAIYNGVAEWMDVTSDEDLDKVLPNRNKFSTLFSRTDMFDN